MARLYIDTSELLVAGLLDDDLSWIDHETAGPARGPRSIHRVIHDLLSRRGLAAGDLDGVVQAAGPGSYTGVRLAEGVSQVLEWLGADVANFYHFETPRLLGVPRGAWTARAFKGEVFVHRWDGDGSSSGLVREADRPRGPGLFTHFPSPLAPGAGLTSEMARERPRELAGAVLARGARLAPWYYRPPEREFAPPGRR